MIAVLTRHFVALFLLIVAAVMGGEILLIAGDAPTTEYIWRRFARLASAQNFWLNWLFIGVAFLSLLIGALPLLIRRVSLKRIVGIPTILYFAALFLQLLRFAVLFMIGVEPEYELVMYALAKASSLASDGARSILTIPILLPVVATCLGIIGYMLHRHAARRIQSLFKENASEDHRPVREMTPVKWSMLIVASVGLLSGLNMTHVNETLKAIVGSDVGTPAKVEVPAKPTVDQWPYGGYYRTRYGYNLKKGTNLVIYMMESVRDEYVEPERSRYFRKVSEVRRIKRFYVPIPHSSNSHYSLLTGRNSSRSARWTYGKVRAEATMPGVLARKGYRSYYMTSGPAWYDGEDKMLRRIGMRIIQRKDLDRYKNPRTGRRYRRFGWGLNDIAMLDGLRRLLKTERGPFMMLHVFTNTHTPYWNPYPGRYKRFNGRTRRGSHRNGIDWTMDLIDRMTDEYKKHGLFKNTVFILLSDHGESFGEHGFRMHDFSLYNTELRIPFIMRHPEFRHLDDIQKFPVGTILDVFPTLMDMLGIPYPEPVHGRSLFAPNYRLKLILRSWGSDAYAGYLLDETKWIHGRRRRELKRMTLDDGEIRVLPSNPATRRFVRELRSIRFE